MEPASRLTRNRGMARDRGARRSLSTLNFALTCALIVIATSSPAAAKGPGQATIDGPGVAPPISLRSPGEPAIGKPLATMIQESGFFGQLHGADAPWRHERPDGELGPRYVVTYRLGSRYHSPSIIQYVYPYASEGPVTYMPADQRSWTSQTTTGGWHRTNASLKDMLIAAGLPEQPPGTTVKATDERQDTPPPIPLLIAFAALATAAVIVRRTQPKTL